MDVEKTIQFILECQARNETNIQALHADVQALHADVQALRADGQGLHADVAELTRSQERTDKQVKATADLVRAGMRIVMAQGANQRRMQAQLTAMNIKVDRIYDLLTRQHRNGRSH